MALKKTLTRGERVVAALLALAWIGGGLVAIVLAAATRQWPALLLGALAAGYGLVWARVAVLGRRLDWPARRGRRGG